MLNIPHTTVFVSESITITRLSHDGSLHMNRATKSGSGAYLGEVFLVSGVNVTTYGMIASRGYAAAVKAEGSVERNEDAAYRGALRTAGVPVLTRTGKPRGASA